MRILLLADVHGNWTALQSIKETFDVCFFLGDLVDYGPEPVPCIEWMEKHAQFAVRGNHDHAVAQHAPTNGRNGFKYLSTVTRQVTWGLLGPRHLRYLASLPLTRVVTLGGVRFLLVHATPRDPLDEYLGDDLDVWTRRLQNVDADVICVGHTHLPYVMQVGSKLVINPGSVGQPRDGDPRAGYAIWEDGKIELKRIAYPVDSLLHLIDGSSLPDNAKLLSREVFRTGAGNVAEITRLIAN